MKKRLFAILAFMVLLIGVLSAKAYDLTLKEFHEVIEEIDEECPTEASDGCYIISVELDDEYKTLDYYFYTNEEVLSIKDLKTYKEEFKDALLDAFLDKNDENVVFIYNLLKKFGYGVCFSFINDDDEVETFVYFAEDI